MIRSFLLPVAAALLATACATQPLRPDPSVDLIGEWRVIAVDGIPTPPGRPEAFRFRYAPPTGSAQFGCNDGNGAARVANGWFIAGDWIITAAGCPGTRARLERKGFAILGRPAAIEPLSPLRVHLRNERGSITLERVPVPQLAGTRWRVVSVNGVPAPFGGWMRFEAASYEANFGCNRFFGSFWQRGREVELGMSSGEVGCPALSPGGISANTYEEWAQQVLAGPSGTIVSSAGPGMVRIENTRGAILLGRMP